MKDTSVVVCAMNAQEIIGDCLRSVKENDPREIIVVDGRSKDRTVEIAKQYADRVLFDEGKGLGAARNMGAHAATGTFVAFVGPDNIMPPGSLGTMKQHLLEDNYSLVSCRTLVKHNGTYFGWAQNMYRGKYTSGEKSIVGTPVIGRRETFETYKFDPAMTWSDDTDVAERMRKDGHRFNIAPTECFEIGSSQVSAVTARWKKYGESDFLFYKKYASKWGILRKIQSLLHPLHTELITPFQEIGAVKTLLILPFLLFLIVFRYYGWLVSSFKKQ